MVGPEDLLFAGTLVTRVAGYRYQVCEPASPGEPVHFIREPDNRADANAVAVHNILGQRIGYLFRELAEEYAALLDLAW